MWDFINWMVDLHMPNYITKALLKTQHPAQSKPQHTIQNCPDPVQGTGADSDDRHQSPTLQRTHQTRAGYCWHTPLLRMCSWPHHSSSHQPYCLLASSRHGSHGRHMSSTSWLCCYTFQCRHLLPRKQHDPRGPHQCIVSFQTQCTQLGISALLPYQQRQ